jgi:hypothetical protein
MRLDESKPREGCVQIIRIHPFSFIRWSVLIFDTMKHRDYKRVCRGRRTTTTVNYVPETLSTWVETAPTFEFVFNRIEGPFRIEDKLCNGVKVGEVRIRI